MRSFTSYKCTNINVFISVQFIRLIRSEISVSKRQAFTTNAAMLNQELFVDKLSENLVKHLISQHSNVTFNIFNEKLKTFYTKTE